MLLVLDDAASEAQVRPLLPGAASCAGLVTSRSRLPALTGAHRIELDVLGPAEALALLARVAGAERVAAEPAAARCIARLCGRLPLALRTAGAHLAIRRHRTLRTMVERLSDEHRRLDELAVGDIAVRASVALSYEALDDRARRAFRLLGALGVPDFAPWLVTALLDTDARAADDIIERLTDAHLLSVASGGRGVGQLRYRLHDLHRVYAAERAAVEDAPQLLRDATTRALGSWLWLIRRHAVAAPSGELELCAHYTTARGGAPVAEDGAAWYEPEAAALVAAVERAAALDLALPAREVALALGSSSFGVANRFEEWWRTHDAAIAATRRAADRSGEAMLLAGLGQLRYSQDRYGEAPTYFERRGGRVHPRVGRLRAEVQHGSRAGGHQRLPVRRPPLTRRLAAHETRRGSAGRRRRLLLLVGALRCRREPYFLHHGDHRNPERGPGLVRRVERPRSRVAHPLHARVPGARGHPRWGNGRRRRVHVPGYPLLRDDVRRHQQVAGPRARR
ncbi:hypothetical protein [Streptomyces sp. NBC_00069]|uniref:hypothetical protein n=1 Tax=Streptomyces sp. NBC_00069 TaxID=2975639 RepID=UPI00324B6C8A